MMFWYSAFFILFSVSCIHAFNNGDAFRNDYRQEQMYRDGQRMKSYQINANRFRDYNKKTYENPQWIPYRPPYRKDYLSSYERQRQVYPAFEDFRTQGNEFNYQQKYLKDQIQNNVPKMKSDEPIPTRREPKVESDAPLPTRREPKMKSDEPIPTRREPKMESDAPIPTRREPKMKSDEPRQTMREPKMKSRDHSPSFLHHYWSIHPKSFHGNIGDLGDPFKQQMWGGRHGNQNLGDQNSKSNMRRFDDENIRDFKEQTALNNGGGGSPPVNGRFGDQYRLSTRMRSGGGYGGGDQNSLRANIRDLKEETALNNIMDSPPRGDEYKFNKRYGVHKGDQYKNNIDLGVGGRAGDQYRFSKRKRWGNGNWEIDGDQYRIRHGGGRNPKDQYRRNGYGGGDQYRRNGYGGGDQYQRSRYGGKDQYKNNIDLGVGGRAGDQYRFSKRKRSGDGNWEYRLRDMKNIPRRFNDDAGYDKQLLYGDNEEYLDPYEYGYKQRSPMSRRRN